MSPKNRIDKSSSNKLVKGRRPRSVAILASIQVLQSLGLFAYAILVSNFANLDSLDTAAKLLRFAPIALFGGLYSGIVYSLLAVLTLVIAIALYLMRPWAWRAAMLIQGVNLFTALVAYMRQRPNYVGMLLGILLVLYLNQQEVQDAFRQPQGAA